MAPVINSKHALQLNIAIKPMAMDTIGTQFQFEKEKKNVLLLTHVLNVHLFIRLCTRKAVDTIVSNYRLLSTCQ